MGLEYGAQGASVFDFNNEVRRSLLNSLALKYHPDKGGDVKHFQYFFGLFKDFISNDNMIRKYTMYLCAPDTFHIMLETKKKFVTYENIELPNGFADLFVPEDIAIVPEPIFRDREMVHPIFCHPKLSYDHGVQKYFALKDEFESDGIEMAYKAKFGRFVYYALRFVEKPQIIFWIARKDALKAKYLTKLAKNSFFRFKKVKRIQNLGEFSMNLRTVKGRSRGVLING
uniref:J domain-containing protein n=1 Tax=Panagrolaimus superbus TaxID=310955 RepID=A0A914Z215_9BILA